MHGFVAESGGRLPGLGIQLCDPPDWEVSANIYMLLKLQRLHRPDAIVGIVINEHKR
ncbi:MAG: hypothetical protein DSM106950_39770 [Stigonema ocellatum SAG 48.90 = DSM 106950]|nr:hypothetical protein [Stigonema ocellatum SAG 48.90 = DSM 106950]